MSVEKNGPKEAVAAKKETDELTLEGMQFPQFFSILTKCRVRDGEDLESKELQEIEEGTVVIVEEIRGRRARISKPISGWMSWKQRTGKVLLTSVDKRKQQIGENVLILDNDTNYYLLAKILDFNEKLGLYYVMADQTRKEYWLGTDSGRMHFLGSKGLEALPRLAPDILAHLHPRLKEQLRFAQAAQGPFGYNSSQSNSFERDQHTFGRFKGDPTMSRGDQPPFRDPRERGMENQRMDRGDPREFGYRKEDAVLMDKYMRRRLVGDGRMDGEFKREMISRDPREMRSSERDPMLDARMNDHRMDSREFVPPNRMEHRDDPRRDPRFDPRREREMREMRGGHRGPMSRSQEQEWMDYMIMREQENQRRLYEYYVSRKHYEMHKRRGPDRHKARSRERSNGRNAPPPMFDEKRNMNSRKQDRERMLAKRVNNAAQKQMIILRGFPGAGKTNIAKQITEMFGGHTLICSEDRYHWTGGDVGVGTFVFKPEINWQTRDWCAREVIDALRDGVPLIVVDNINYRIIHYEEHIRAAYHLGYTVKILEIVHNPELVPKFRARCKLNLAEEEWLRLSDKWETDPRVQLLYPSFVSTTNDQIEAMKQRALQQQQQQQAHMQSPSQPTSPEKSQKTESPNKSQENSIPHFLTSQQQTST